MKKIFILGIAFLALQVVFAQEVDLSGEWTIVQETPRGKRSSDISIKHEGSSASVWSKDGEYIMTIDGDSVRWKQEIKTPMGAMEAACEGKIESVSKMSGTSSISEGFLSGRSINWTADRKEVGEEKVDKKKKNNS